MTLLLPLEEIVNAIVRGVVIVTAGFILYKSQKHFERKSNKRDMARILRIEINRALNILPNRERERTISDQNDRLPSSNVYLGLLQTGNIRFFSDTLQDKLAEWHSIIDNFWNNNKIVVGIEMVQDLEDMERNNLSFSDMIRMKNKKL